VSAPVRPARPSDAAEIAEIWNHYIRETAVTFNSTQKSRADVTHEIETRPAFLVVEAQGRVAGFATWSQFRGGVGYAYTVENTVLLAPGAQGGGLGRALVEALVATARAAGHHSMIAGVSGENPGGAAFHARLGFVEVARLPQVGHKFGRWMDLVLMQRKL